MQLYSSQSSVCCACPGVKLLKAPTMHLVELTSPKWRCACICFNAPTLLRFTDGKLRMDLSRAHTGVDLRCHACAGKDKLHQKKPVTILH